MNSPVRNERGLALLSALLSVALLTLIVVEMTDTAFVHTQLTRNAGNALAAQLLARSGQIGASAVLEEARDNEQIQRFVDALVDAPPLTLPTARGHTMQIRVRDEMGRLNLNEAQEYDEAFQNLFAELDLDPGLLEALQARIDGANAGLRNVGEDCNLAVACDPPLGPLRSFDDLQTIRGFDPQTMARIRPFVTVHQSRKNRGAINLRTARAEVLRAIGCEDTEALPPPPRASEDIQGWLESGPCGGAKPRPRDMRSQVYSILSAAQVGDATQAVEATIEVGKGPIAWKQRPVWGVGPGEVL